MAWRLTPYETAAAGVTVKATLLNGIQEAINDLFNGAYSVKNLFVDGVGDVAAALGAGVIAKITGGSIQFEGASGDTNPAIEFTGAVVNRKLAERYAIGTIRARTYQDSGAAGKTETINAYWNGAQWARDAAGDSWRVIYKTSSIAMYYYAAGDGSPWADAAWNLIYTIDTGSIIAALAAQFNSLFCTGNITSSTGDITASAGDVIATAGMLQANGTVAGDSGPAVVKGKRLHLNGPALSAAGDWAIDAAWGDAAVKTSISGDDHLFTVNVASAGIGQAANAQITVTFKALTFTGAPSVMAVLDSTDDVAVFPVVAATATDTAATLTFKGTPLAGKFYQFKCWAKGN